jgi:DNA repair protein RadD
MNLRDYQQGAIDMLRDSLRRGKKRPVVMAPTGAGKTVIAAAIINMARQKGKKVIFCVPMLSLIDQTVDRFYANGIYDVGVIQGMHELTDWRMPVQVCSIQTLMRRKIPEADLVIVDEAHVMYRFLGEWIDYAEWKDIPFVGLTATPWQRGMGKVWDDLIIAVTTQELINRGHLSDFKVFAPAHPDLKNVKTVAGDYELKGLADAMDQGQLVADIVSTWLERGENRQTICFAVNRTHAKHIQQQFIDAGIVAEYMDAHTDRMARNEIVKRFDNGDVKVICNVGVLTTGFDADVRCIILARPTKSEILYTQMIGRGLRTAVGKDHCLILDHSDTTVRLGFVTDIHHTELDDGSRKEKKEPTAKEKLPKECPKCAFLRPPKVRECPACGFVPEPRSDVETAEGELYELTRDKVIKPKDWPRERKEMFYRELVAYARSKGWKEGWAYHAYKSRLKVGPPPGCSRAPADAISSETMAWIKHHNIAKAKGRENAERKGNSQGKMAGTTA